MLAAHSGEGRIAYFNKLIELSEGDEIEFKYYDETYIYVVDNIYEQEKNGYIKFSKRNESQLILTTCSTQNNKMQLIVEAKIKKSI